MRNSCVGTSCKILFEDIQGNIYIFEILKYKNSGSIEIPFFLICIVFSSKISLLNNINISQKLAEFQNYF